ncbi:MAG TPA: DUF1598 domain-containing protein [Pirellulales bacterium]|jgi:hypothetical protein
MLLSLQARRALALFTFAALAILAPTLAVAQNTFQMPAGVIVDPTGVFKTKVYDDPGGALVRQRIADAKATMDPKLFAKSKSRKVSLNRLQKAIEARLAEGRKPTDEMLSLAGLTRLQNVLVYPDSGDIVIAGPADGWVKDVSGRIVSVTSGRPVLELQDLVVALRAYPPNTKDSPKIGCSIDPTPEGLQRFNAFFKSVRDADPHEQAEFIANGLKNALGPQKVRIEGVAPNTHFAQVMVEADYRMKLIGIGLERPPVKLASYAEKAAGGGKSGGLQRWYFMPDYKCVRTTEDHLAMELVGDGVKLVGEHELVQADGKRVVAGAAGGASALFASNFTKKYPDLAAKSPVFAQLRNLIDMAVAAAFIQQNDLYGKAGWEPELFTSEAEFPVQTYVAPVEADTAVNIIYHGNSVSWPIGGGVTVHAHKALDDDNLLTDEGNKVNKLREATKVEGLAEGQWWWD